MNSFELNYEIFNIYYIIYGKYRKQKCWYGFEFKRKRKYIPNKKIGIEDLIIHNKEEFIE